MFVFHIDLYIVLNPGRNTKERKSIKENDFLMFGFTMETVKENTIELKLVRSLYLFKSLIFT